MGSRSWPWKKKSTEKSAAEASSDAAVATLSSLASISDQENYRKVNYVQISLESYKHLTGLEDEVKELKERLLKANLEISTQDCLIKQHVKLAEEAVSGWEKANAEALVLRRELESVTLAKVAAEDHACGLDDVLKEHTRQMRNVREESEKISWEAVLAKTKEWSKMKLDLEAKVVELNHGLLRAEDENVALSRSLKEQSDVIAKLEEEKSQAQAEIEYLKGKYLSREKEVNSLRYELHLISEEIDIRNEEKNISIRSAETANKQHQESVKTVVKLEAECQRLRGLVRRKLPGPAALAKMKVEVDYLDQDVKTCRNLVKKPNHKEIEFLTTRLLAVEEETKMLKEALSTRNRLKSIQAQGQTLVNEQRIKDQFDISAESPSSEFAGSAPRSITSVSEDGIDEEASSSEILGPAISGSFRRINFKFHKQAKGNQLELMDDFLEMERLATMAKDANDANGAASASSHP